MTRAEKVLLLVAAGGRERVVAVCGPSATFTLAKDARAGGMRMARLRDEPELREALRRFEAGEQ